MLPRLLTLSLVGLAALAAPRAAHAIVMNVPCDSPSVFANAPVNVVVLPYSQPASFGSARTQAGEQLSALVQLESMLAIAKFGGIGLTQLVGDPTDGCTPERVLDKLLGRQDGAIEKMKPGGGLILIWGRIFESGDDLFLQTFVRFMRAGVTESIAIGVGTNRTLTGALSGQAFACAPRKIALRDLDDIQRQFAAARLLHQRPDAASPVVPIPEGGPFSYWITGVKGDWVQLQPMERRPGNDRRLTPGWLLVRASDASWSLRRQMPELFFVEGAAGYLAARIQPNSPSAAGWLTAADTAIERYLQAWGANAVLGPDAAAGGTPLAIAVPRQLHAFVALQRTRGADAALAEAQAQFERAAALVPHSGDAKNLVAMIRIARAYRQPAPGRPPRQFVDELRSLLGSDPDNRSLLTNLAVAYELALADTGVADLERQRLLRERNRIAAMRKAS